MSTRRGFVGRFTKLLSPRSRFASKGRKKKTKNSGMRITNGYLWRETSMKAGRRYSVCVCIRRTRPSLNIICPWSCEEERVSHLFCQDILDLPFQLLASRYYNNCRRPLAVQIAKKQARTTSKYAIAKYTQAFSTSNITASQRRQFFLIVPPQCYWPLLHVCRFLYSLNKKARQRQDNFFA